MRVLTSSYHLDEPLAALRIGGEAVLTDAGTPDWLCAHYGRIADAVAAGGWPVVVAAGDCLTSLAVLAGLQRAGIDPGIVWFDAHGDFNTPQITDSGYIGGMPLAVAVGRAELPVATSLGLTPIDERQVLLTDARDLDPRERDLLERSLVRRLSVPDLLADGLPDGQLYLHLDLDVVDAAEAPGLRYPVADGPGRQAVLEAYERVLATGRVVAIGIACTFTADAAAGDEAWDLVRGFGLAP